MADWTVGELDGRSDRAAAVVLDRGGVIEQEPVDAADRDRLAIVSDSEGALVLLLRAAGGDPPDADPGVGDWLWHELWTHDVEAAMDACTVTLVLVAQTRDRR